jgi:hypothetical protein
VIEGFDVKLRRCKAAKTGRRITRAIPLPVVHEADAKRGDSAEIPSAQFSDVPTDGAMANPSSRSVIAPTALSNVVGHARQA